MPAGRLPEHLVHLVMLPLTLVVVSCGPVVVVRDGHRVFNPAYTFALDWRDRDVWQKPEEVMSVLDVVEGDVVADLGAGSGYFSEWLSRRVGPAGRVYATDVQDAMLSTLRRRVVDRGLTNVEVVRATFDDPTLPDACCKVILLSSVYKEIDGRVAYMRKVTHALEPGGRVAILEYRPEAAGPGPPRELRLDARQVIDELGTAGFALVARHEFIDRQYFLVFARAKDPRVAYGTSLHHRPAKNAHQVPCGGGPSTLRHVAPAPNWRRIGRDLSSGALIGPSRSIGFFR